MLILFDIDGTLLLSNNAGKKAMVEAGRRLVGDHFTFDGVDVAGRIDPLIWADAAAANGVSDRHVSHDAFRAAYVSVLTERFATNPTSRALPGVHDLVARLKTEPGVTLGILTGNYPETGCLKVRAAGLEPDDFPVAAWGSDGEHRRDLPRVAMTRYHALGRRPITPDRVVIIGDTPHDIDCARAAGCRVLAVATGPSYGHDDLAALGPDRVVADLTATDEIVAWMLSFASASGAA